MRAAAIRVIHPDRDKEQRSSSQDTGQVAAKESGNSVELSFAFATDLVNQTSDDISSAVLFYDRWAIIYETVSGLLR